MISVIDKGVDVIPFLVVRPEIVPINLIVNFL